MQWICPSVPAQVWLRAQQPSQRDSWPPSQQMHLKTEPGARQAPVQPTPRPWPAGCPQTRQGAGPFHTRVLCLPGAPAPPPASVCGATSPPTWAATAGLRASSRSQARAPGLAPVGSSRPRWAAWAVLQERPALGGCPPGTCSAPSCPRAAGPHGQLSGPSLPQGRHVPMASSQGLRRAGWSSAAREWPGLSL